MAAEPAIPENPDAGGGTGVHGSGVPAPTAPQARELGGSRISNSRTCNTVPPAAAMPVSPAPYSQQQCREPNNPSYSRSIQLTPLSFLLPHHSSCCNAGDPRHGGSAHHPRVPSSDTSSSKAPAIPEAHTTTMRAPGNTSDRGSRGWKVPILKYGQRQLR